MHSLKIESYERATFMWTREEPEAAVFHGAVFKGNPVTN